MNPKLLAALFLCGFVLLSGCPKPPIPSNGEGCSSDEQCGYLTCPSVPEGMVPGPFCMGGECGCNFLPEEGAKPPLKEIEFSFSAAPCAGPPEKGFETTLEWLDDSTLQVTQWVELNCSEEVEDGSYEFVGGSETWISLKYFYQQCVGYVPDVPDPEANYCVECLCGQELTYTFSNIEKKDYLFGVEMVPLIGEE